MDRRTHLIAYCGLRSGEACGAHWIDLDLRHVTWRADGLPAAGYGTLAAGADLPPSRLHDAGTDIKVVRNCSATPPAP